MKKRKNKMKFVDGVCSLVLSMRLVYLGLKDGENNSSRQNRRGQNLWWVNESYLMGDWELKQFSQIVHWPVTLYPAWTVAELGEMLKHKYVNWPDYVNRKWHWVDYEGEELVANTEANIRAMMLIYLIETKKIDVRKINV